MLIELKESLAPHTIKVRHGSVVSISGTVQAATPQGVKIVGPGFAYEDQKVGQTPVQLTNSSYVASADGELHVSFIHPVKLLVGEGDCQYRGKTFVRTFTLATDDLDNPNPDYDFNDLVLNVTVTERAG